MIRPCRDDSSVHETEPVPEWRRDGNQLGPSKQIGWKAKADLRKHHRATKQHGFEQRSHETLDREHLFHRLSPLWCRLSIHKPKTTSSTRLLSQARHPPPPFFQRACSRRAEGPRPEPQRCLGGGTREEAREKWLKTTTATGVKWARIRSWIKSQWNRLEDSGIGWDEPRIACCGRGASSTRGAVAHSGTACR